MKKVMLLSMVLFCTHLYSQQNDTIFLKDKTMFTVYKIIGCNDSNLICIKKVGSKESYIDLKYIERFTKSNKANQSISFEQNYYEKNKFKNELDYKTGWIQYNLNSFYKEERTSQVLYGLSLISGIVYATNPIKNSTFMYVAGGLGLIGFVVHIDSYKWIKRASIETTMKGVSLKIKL